MRFWLVMIVLVDVVVDVLVDGDVGDTVGGDGGDGVVMVLIVDWRRVLVILVLKVFSDVRDVGEAASERG